jgi:hypothetical protein
MSLAPLPKLAKGIGGDDHCAVENNVTTTVTGNLLKIKGSDDDDGDDGKSARLSDRHPVPAIGERKPVTIALSDIDAAREELGERGEITAQSVAPPRRHRQRIRLHLTTDALSAAEQGQAGTRKYLKRDA